MRPISHRGAPCSPGTINNPVEEHPITIAAPPGADLADFLAEKSGSLVLPDERLAVLDLLSQRVLADSELRRDPASVALAFWLRRGNMVKMREQFLSRLATAAGTVPVPAGKVFHIAPANVDTLFVYSWALSFFCGNRNVVRLSTRTGPVVQALLRCIAAVMENAPLLRNENLFVQYERSDEVNARFSAWCSHRIVWGGNETVNALRRVPLNPHASERAFASKYSWSVLRAAAWPAADQAKLADSFYNDVFWFDQMACSSPHVLFWIGAPEETEAAAGQFDAALTDVISRRQHTDELSTAVRRRNHAFSQATDEGVIFDPAQSAFTSVRVQDWRRISRETCGGGYLTHTCAATLEEIADFVTDEDQTVTHFGFETADLEAFARLAGARGLDRIVPVGQALSFSPDWDGYSLLQDFVRLVTVSLT
jgi:hypothetical protein